MRSKTAAVLVLLLATSTVRVALGVRTSQYIFRSTYTFENRGNERYFFTDDDATIPLFASNNWQSASVRNLSHDIIREFEDDDNNKLAILDFPDSLDGGQTVVFSFEYVIDSKSRDRPQMNPVEAGSISDIPQSLVESYVSETETFSRNEEIEALAKRLASGQDTVLDVLVNMIDWIEQNVTYSNFDVPQYPHETYTERRGDCDDQAILLISMLRSVGVPALLQVGVVFSDRIEGDRTSWEGHLTIRQEGLGWHGWAMVYVPPWGWLPVDLTLSGTTEPLELISTAPEYENYVVTAFNVSAEPYIGDSRSSREQLISSAIYITVEDAVIEDSSGAGWTNLLYIGTGILAGGSFVVFVIYNERRKRARIESL
ncbi:MAG: transglutaminase domain-containing protein [Candidatus Bathyarchaeota archaeon]|nr:MAG: transglutaminase domain-containing protein [Candidatus Bathyarchaeota archaeon]